MKIRSIYSAFDASEKFLDKSVGNYYKEATHSEIMFRNTEQTLAGRFSMRKAICLLTWSVLLAGGQSAWAQLTGASISGTIRDETGATVPGVTVVVKNLETGVTRTTVTAQEGAYHAPDLPVGAYEVTATLSGFQTDVRSGITLTVGRQAVVDFALKIGEVSQTVTVAGEAPLVETTTSSVSALVSETQIRDLPLNGRDFTQLTLLEAGVSKVLNVGTATSKGFGITTTIAGARPADSVYMLDGTDINTPSTFGLPGSVAGFALGVDTVQEFEVLLTNFGAEFGRAAGGVINAVTRSGTNTFHGSAFEFLRNSDLDARSFFDRGSSPPPFKRNQFGGTFGGPIRRDKTFFFGSYEGLRQRLLTSNTDNVPNLAARQGLLPTPGNPGQLTPVPLSPSVVPYLNFFPVPNGPDNGNGTAQYLSTISNPVTENFFVIKADHRLSGKDSLFARESFDNASILSKIPGYVNALGLNSSRMQYLTVSEQHVFGPRLVNSLQLAFNRSRITQGNQTLKDSTSLTYIPGVAKLGEADVPGLSDIGASARLPNFVIQNMWQVNDNVSYSAGAHTLKFGFLLERFQYNAFGPDGQGGWYQFSSLQNYLAGQAATVFFDLPSSNPQRGYRQSLFGFYAQDDFKLNSRFTLNLGLRYEFVTTPFEVNGLGSNVRNILTSTNYTVGPLFSNPSVSWRSLSPRVGFAWDTSGNGKLAIRGSFGIFDEPLVPNTWKFGSNSSPPGTVLASATNVSFPNFYAQSLLPVLATTTVPASAISNATMNYQVPSNPYLMKWSLSLERQLGPSMVFSAMYLGNRANHIGAAVDFNTIPGVQLPNGRWYVAPGGTQRNRRNPNIGPVVLDPMFDDSSSYHALLLKLNKRFTKGLQFQAGYTFSKMMDNSTTAGGLDYVATGWAESNPDCLKCEHGMANIDQRHNFVANFRYDLPFGSQKSGLAAHLFGGWQAGGIFTVSAGNPFSLTIGYLSAPNLARLTGNQRPDLVSGCSNNPISPRNPNRYFKVACFAAPAPGFFGNLGRDTLISPGLVDVDFSLFKNMTLGERKTLQFRAEVFNVANRANFARPASLNVLASTGVVASSAQITSTTVSSRQIQFGLKFIF